MLCRVHEVAHKMNHLTFFVTALTTAFILMSGCDRKSPESVEAIVFGSVEVAHSLEPEAAQLVSNNAFWPAADMLVTDEKNGLFLLDRQGKELSHIPGGFSGLDHRADAGGILLALLDSKSNKAMLVRLDGSTRQWQGGRYLPDTDFYIENLCLYSDVSGNGYLFLIGEEGEAEQWLVASRGVPLEKMSLVQSLNIAPQGGHCRVDDITETLYVNEEDLGLWAYPAHPEAGKSRRPVDLVAPLGSVRESVSGMTVLPARALMALDPSAGYLYRYEYQGEGWLAQSALRVDGLNEPEQIDVREDGMDLVVLARGDGGLHRSVLNWRPAALTAPVITPVVDVEVQTVPVPNKGDAADDPAIWVHPVDPQRSRIIGTDKKGGLASYNLSGDLIQYLSVGRVNNVDLRKGFRVGDRQIDLAVATNRDRNSLHFFAIDTVSGDMTDLGDIPTPLQDIYGFCMFRDEDDNTFYVIPNDKDGTFLQYRVSATANEIEIEEVRRFKLESQPEGCVADDAGQRLYVGEEKSGVWTLDARADRPATLEKVISVDGQRLHSDVEGLAIWQADDKAYLVISSQGNDSYVITDAVAPYTFRGAFRIGVNISKGIDGASETDGLEVTSSNLGGVWGRGLLVVQDGRNRMPEQTQNYKLVPWSAIAKALDL
ncbi:MAG: phytase [Alcanivoracaceae bacterium]|jgi:3-phytase|nr:phytase [Alcanivoracaceae bacterium]